MWYCLQLWIVSKEGLIVSGEVYDTLCSDCLPMIPLYPEVTWSVQRPTMAYFTWLQYDDDDDDDDDDDNFTKNIKDDICLTRQNLIHLQS